MVDRVGASSLVAEVTLGYFAKVQRDKLLVKVKVEIKINENVL